MGRLGRLGVVGLVALTAWLGWVEGAWACRPYRPAPAEFMRPFVVDSPVEVAKGTIVVKCEETRSRLVEDSQLLCRFHAQYALRNGTSAPQSARGLVIVEEGRRDDVRVAGVVATENAPDADVQQWLDAMGPRYEHAEPEMYEARQFNVALAPGGTTVVSHDWTGSIRLPNPGCSIPATYTRHPLFSRDDGHLDMRIMGPTQHAAIPYDVTLDLPPRWRVRADGARLTRTEDRTARHPTFQWSNVDIGAESNWSLYRNQHFFRGGPFAFGGVEIGDGVRPRFNAGWEIAAPWPFLMHSLALETNTRSVSLVPMTEIATANVWGIFPSFGVGLGVPVQLWPDPRAAVRTQFSLGWPFVSLVGTLDMLPRRGRRPGLIGGIGLMASF